MTKNFHGHILDLLGIAILSGRYAVGASLPPEPLLCDELGVSRTVVREAIKSLVAKGLLSTGPKVGTRVLPDAHWNWFDPDVVAWQAQCGLTPEFLKDLQELRRVVEPAAVRLAAERATPEDIALIEQAYAGMKKAVEEGGDYVTYDMRFHQGLLQASHNRMLVQMSKALNALLRTSFEISTRIKDGPKNSLPLHRAVLNAVAAHEPVEAERAIMVLIEGARQDIDQVLSSRRKLPTVSGQATPIKTQSKAKNIQKITSKKRERFLQNSINAFFKLLEFLVVACLVAMVIMVFGNVVLRYGFNSGISISDEMSRYCFIWLTYIGAMVAMREKGHLGVDTLVRRLPLGGKKLCFFLSEILMLGCNVLFFWGTWQMHDLQLTNISPVVGISMIWIYGIGYVTASVMAIMNLHQLSLLLTGRLAEKDLVMVVESEDKVVMTELDPEVRRPA